MDRSAILATIVASGLFGQAAYSQWAPSWEADWIGSNRDLGSSEPDPRYYVMGWNSAGQIGGISNRATGDGLIDLGQDTWVYDSGTTRLVGLIDAAHTATSGKRRTGFSGITENGTVIGGSMRYTGNTQAGFSAWVYRDGATTDITLPGAEDSDLMGATDSGYVLGDGRIGTLYTAWRWRNGVRTIVGLTDADHTGPGGARSSHPTNMYLAANGGSPTARFINEAGHCIGESTRYVGGVAAGTTAWLYDGSNTVALELADADHTGSDGYRESHALHISETDDVVGVSYRRSGTGPLGQSMWLYRAGVLTILGLSGPQYLAPDGGSESGPIGVATDGTVFGNTRQYGLSGSSWLVPWAYVDGAYTILGIHDAAHTGPNGEQQPSVGNGQTVFSWAGVIAGTTDRFDGRTKVGANSWWWTRTAGLHVMDDESPRGAIVQAISPHGLLAGQHGANGWLLDPANAAFTEFGVGSPRPWSVADNGRITGWFSAQGGLSVFLWSQENGITDIADLVEGGFPGCTWSRLDTGNPIYTDPIVLNDVVLAGAFASDGPGIATALFRPIVCGSADFNHDCDVGTDADIEAFFACLAGACCQTCGSVDFNHDGDSGTDADIEAFFRVLAGGTC